MKNYRHSEADEWKRAKKKTSVRVKQVALSTLRRKLDKLFSVWIRKRDADEHGMGRCITCNQWRLLQCGHFVRRQHTAGRWVAHNAHGQCAGCNIRGCELEHYEAIIKLYGIDEARRIRALKHQTVKFQRQDLLDLILKYSA